ncbi:MAG TPA: hypothetical protein H9687_05085 [Firmicutes bacterium]|nr:hypothetical protein [Bacillota bacterium]
MGENPFTQGFIKYNLNWCFGGGWKINHCNPYPGHTKEQYIQLALELA